jgi:hypothetical protein
MTVEFKFRVYTTESSSAVPFSWKDSKSNTDFRINFEPGSAALLLIGKDGQILAFYNTR